MGLLLGGLLTRLLSSSSCGGEFVLPLGKAALEHFGDNSAVPGKRLRNGYGHEARAARASQPRPVVERDFLHRRRRRGAAESEDAREVRQLGGRDEDVVVLRVVVEETAAGEHLCTAGEDGHIRRGARGCEQRRQPLEFGRFLRSRRRSLLHRGTGCSGEAKTNNNNKNKSSAAASASRHRGGIKSNPRREKRTTAPGVRASSRQRERRVLHDGDRWLGLRETQKLPSVPTNGLSSAPHG